MNTDLLKNIRRVVPYAAGERPDVPGIIKLNTNENPYPPSPGVIEAQMRLDPGTFRLYPDPESKALKEAAAKFYGLEALQVFPANGSDDALALIFMTYFNSGKPVLFPDVTYSFYPVWCDLYKISYETVPLNEEYAIEPDGYSRENGGIILANPNAPTGVAFGRKETRQILEANPGVIVVIDEAYVDFGAESAVPLIGEYDNLIVVHTFSKYRALAGARIALAFGNAELIAFLTSVKNSYNSYPLDFTAQVLAVAALEDDAYYRAAASRIAQTRERFVRGLDNLGFETLPSQANYVLTKHGKADAKSLFDYLREHKIYVRYFEKPRLSDFLRITIGTNEQMDAVLERIKKFLCG
ncbi:MAG: histidinol-phosphate transaminase [Defluviitaleaceae bacterium]|nr:histidinol-phosphate transaminase [Defluviitaleaceae bacterium]